VLGPYGLSCHTSIVLGCTATAQCCGFRTWACYVMLGAAGAQGKSGGGGGAGRDRVLADLAADIAGRLPEPFDIEAVCYKYPVDYHESMNTVLTQVRLVPSNELALSFVAVAGASGHIMQVCQMGPWMSC
jgi:hypothetical protein